MQFLVGIPVLGLVLLAKELEEQAPPELLSN